MTLHSQSDRIGLSWQTGLANWKTAVKNATPSYFPSTWQFLVRFSGLIVIAIFVSGCAAELTRVDLSQVDAPPAELASVYVIRPAYLSYAARDLTITANKTEVVDLSRLSYTSFLMAPGKLHLSGKGGFFSWPFADITIDIKAGESYFLVWRVTETASSALMNMLFPTIIELRWESISRKEAQPLLDSIYYEEPTFQEIPLIEPAS